MPTGRDGWEKGWCTVPRRPRCLPVSSYNYPRTYQPRRRWQASEDVGEFLSLRYLSCNATLCSRTLPAQRASSARPSARRWGRGDTLNGREGEGVHYLARSSYDLPTSTAAQ